MTRYATFHDLEGRSVFITGGGSGIGAALTEGFLEQGARVAFVQRSDAGDFVAEMSARHGNTPLFLPCDIVDIAALRVAMARAAELHGPFTVLVNNAANDQRHAIEDYTVEEWDRAQAINLRPHFFTAQAAAPGMKAARHGRIINISSGAGLGPSLTGIQAYAAAKAGQINLTRQLCHELGPYNITVNNIAPGFVRSNPTTEKQWQSYGEEGQKALIERIALHRLGHPEDIAHGVLFFASDYAGWISGQVLSIDGGK